VGWSHTAFLWPKSYPSPDQRSRLVILLPRLRGLASGPRTSGRRAGGAISSHSDNTGAHTLQLPPLRILQAVRLSQLTVFPWQIKGVGQFAASVGPSRRSSPACCTIPAADIIGSLPNAKPPSHPGPQPVPCFPPSMIKRFSTTAESFSCLSRNHVLVLPLTSILRVKCDLGCIKARRTRAYCFFGWLLTPNIAQDAPP